MTATSPYHDLLTTLDSLRKRTARFRRVALHLHSPDSRDWNQTGDKTLNDRDRLRAAGGETEFINALKQHFDLVVITDHMKCSYASRVSNSSRNEQDFLVLPGMEVNIQPEAAISCSRLHVLAILPEGASTEGFSRLFAGLNGIPDDTNRTGNEEVAGLRLADWIGRVHRENGLCVAAHVNSQQGVRHHFRQTGADVIRLLSIDPDTQDEQERDLTDELKEYLLGVRFDAIEIAKAADKRHYRWASTLQGHEVTIPVTMQLDAHCIEDFARSDRVSWIKMTTLNLKGLRDALKFPETRIRFASDLPTPPSPRLLGIEIVGDSNSLFEKERIAFAENLNCLIGPRGSGKSTIVEALRYVFGYNRTLKELDSTNKLSDRIRDMQRANLSGCLIRVVYQTQASDRRVIEATFDPQEDYATNVFSADGEQLAVADVEQSGDFPLRLFGWSEIETLGRDPARQRDLLDRLVPELPAAKQERDALRAQLRANRKDVEKIANELKALFARQNGLIRRYSEYKAAFEKLNTDDIKKHFADLDLALMKAQVLQLVQKNVDGFAARVQELDIATLREGLDDLLTPALQLLRDWWLTDAIPKLGLVNSETDTQKHLAAAAQVLKGLLGGLVRGGLTIVGSWPITTEMAHRLRARESAALAASVHLVCRPRDDDAAIGDWGEIVRELPKRIGDWMERLSGEGIRGADLVFACVGPALELFSKYARVETPDGEEVGLAASDKARGEPARRGFLSYVWEFAGRTALNQVLGSAESRARNGAAGALEEDARLTALFLWTLQATEAAANGKAAKKSADAEDDEANDADEGDDEGEETGGKKGKKKAGLTLIYDVARRFAQPLGIHLDVWEGRIIETAKGVVRLLPVGERAKQLFGEDGAAAVVRRFDSTKKPDPQGMLDFMAEQRAAAVPEVKGRGRKKKDGAEANPESLRAKREATTLDRVHAAMLLQASGASNALRAMLEAEVDRGPDFLRLANALSALYPRDSEEKRLLDAMLLAVPR